MKLIYGRAGTGKTEYIFNDIKNKIASEEKIYIITPEQFSYTAEKRLLDTLGDGAVLQVEVLSFERMAYRVINETISNIDFKIEKSGKSMIIFDAINKEQKKLRFLGKSIDNVETIIKQITEFKKHNINVEILKKQVEETEDEYLKLKLNDMLIMYTKFEEVIEGRFLDENDVLTMLAENIEKSNLFNNAIFYIDEFAGFTKQEYEVIKKLEDISKELYITICTDSLKVEKSPEADIFYDNKQAIQTLCNISDINKDEQIYLEENHRFKNEELSFMEKNIFGIPYKIYNKEVENIGLSYADNQYVEIENVASKIIKLVRDKGYRFKDIALICNNIDTYSSLCKVIFKEYEIPVFIDEKKEITQNIIIKYILGILDIFVKNWSYETVFNYIKTGIVGIDNIYELENYCLKWGIQGKKFYNEPWNFEKDKKEENEIDENLNFNREQQILIEPLLKLKEEITNNKTVEQISQILYSFLIEHLLNKDMDMRENINTEENIEAFNLITNVLEEMSQIFKDEKISFENYLNLLRTGIATKELNQIPNSNDHVIVGDINRSKTHRVKAVLIIGVNDGVFPRATTTEGFFNDKDRERLKDKGLELAKGIKEKMYEENFNIYKAFSTAEEKLYISYSASDINGDNLRKSLIISRIKKVFPKIIEQKVEKDEVLTKNITFSKLLNHLGEEEWNEVYEWYNRHYNFKLKKALEGREYTNVPTNINIENIQKLYGNNLKTSISKLEKYASCPFSYFLTYGLRLSSKEKLDVRPIDTGSFMHDVIDKFFKQLNEENISVKDVDDDIIERIVDGIVEEKLMFGSKFTLAPKYKIMCERLSKVLYTSIRYIVESLKDSSFEVLGTEVVFNNKEGSTYPPINLETKDGKHIQIEGKIDRIDIAKLPDGKYIRIIDYKSSKKDIELNKVIAGLQLQLITYIDAICKNEKVMPAGALYYSLIEPQIKKGRLINDDKAEIEKLIRQNYKMNGLILADINIVKAMDNSFDGISSSKIPIEIDKKTNEIKESTNLVTREEFENLQKYANKIIKQIANEILSGNIEIKPFYNNKSMSKTPCSYCEFKSICQFNPKLKNNNYRFIPNMEKEKIIDMIKK